MATTYSIRDWEKHFECSQSKRAERLSWVATPNKHDGKSYRRLIQMKNGAALYGAWILIVQVASKCPVRGILADDDGPLSADDIADKTLTDPKLIQSALDACCSKAIGWIVKEDSRSECDTSQSTAIDRGVPTLQDITGQDITEHNSVGGGKPPASPRFIPPTVEEVAAHCAERANRIDPEAFVAHYAKQGWVQSNGRKLTDWKAAVITWEKNDRKRAGTSGGPDLLAGLRESRERRLEHDGR
jgi:hypothetical protein